MKQHCKVCQAKTYHMPSDGCITCYEIAQVLERKPRSRDLVRDLIEAAQLIQDLNQPKVTPTTRAKAKAMLGKLAADYDISPVPF